MGPLRADGARLLRANGTRLLRANGGRLASSLRSGGNSGTPAGPDSCNRRRLLPRCRFRPGSGGLRAGRDGRLWARVSRRTPGRRWWWRRRWRRRWRCARPRLRAVRLRIRFRRWLRIRTRRGARRRRRGRRFGRNLRRRGLARQRLRGGEAQAGDRENDRRQLDAAWAPQEGRSCVFHFIRARAGSITSPLQPTGPVSTSPRRATSKLERSSGLFDGRKDRFSVAAT
jgi:hypothetical protein